MKYHIIYIAAMVIMACSVTATQNRCFSQKEVFTDATGIGGSWKLMPVLASDTASGKLAALQFNVAAGSFLGNTGCNAMSGKFKLSGSMLSFSEQEIITKNTCQGYNEEAFIASLIKVNNYKIENGVLELKVDQTILSKWVRKEPATGVKAI